MSTLTIDALQRLSGQTHRGGAFSSEVLIAIADVLPSGDIKTLETGCGKSTIMFSNLAAKHIVFAYDDRDMPDSSVALVQNDPAFQADRTQFVYGPTQKTIPRHQFADDDFFDVMLIDGPHGYPFPDLEYALLYERLKPGGILILDDVHIASIGNMYDVLREDRMYEEVGVFATTGLLKRTDVEGVPPDGDHWYEQSYNFARFPKSVEKYKIDRTLPPDGIVDLGNPTHVERYAIKSLEVVPDEGAVRTIDVGASLEIFVPAVVGDTLEITLEYKSTYEDASKTASVAFGDQETALPFSREWTTLKTTVPRPEDGRLLVVFDHPDAIAEHYREVTLYDFRRFGTWLRVAEISGNGASQDQGDAAATAVLQDGEFKQALVDFGEGFPYEAAEQEVVIQRVQRIVPRKTHWSAAELLSYEGDDSVDAITYALQNRLAEDAEKLALHEKESAADRLRFALQLDWVNRRTGVPMRLSDVEGLRKLWRTERFFQRRKIKFLRKAFASLYRKKARRIYAKNMAQIATLQNVRKMQERLDIEMGRIEGL